MMVESYLNLEYLVLTPYCHLPGNLRNKKFKVASSAGFMKQVEIFGMWGTEANPTEILTSAFLYHLKSINMFLLHLKIQVQRYSLS